LTDKEKPNIEEKEIEVAAEIHKINLTEKMFDIFKSKELVRDKTSLNVNILVKETTNP
jgi:hypothetical protein